MNPAERDRAARAKAAAAIIASPTDPDVEYVPAGLAGLATCRCPRTVVDDDQDPRSWNLKILHIRGCEVRADPTGPVRLRQRNGVHPCPNVLPDGEVCGVVAYSAGPNGKPERRCWGCNHVWTPPRPQAPTIPAAAPPPRRASRRAPG